MSPKLRVIDILEVLLRHN